ncbi:MAG TPA: O-methyltransferase, partial [Bacteroidia bacterium]|nr:O-methyltransferase [Bacteroidia bacterium]
LSHLVKPRVILEIGTFTGYSALCLSEGLSPDGKIISIDINEEHLLIARKYRGLAGLDDRIEFVTGNAAELIPAMKQEFDLVFIDADKENYPLYYDLVVPKVRSGGLIIADNVLWSGKVADENENDGETESLRKFARLALADERTEQVMLTVRDGLLLLRKK